MLLHLIVRTSRNHFRFVYSQGCGIAHILYNPAQAVKERRVEGSSGSNRFWGELEYLA